MDSPLSAPACPRFEVEGQAFTCGPPVGRSPTGSAPTPPPGARDLATPSRSPGPEGRSASPCDLWGRCANSARPPRSAVPATISSSPPGGRDNPPRGGGRLPRARSRPGSGGRSLPQGDGGVGPREVPWVRGSAWTRGSGLDTRAPPGLPPVHCGPPWPWQPHPQSLPVMTTPHPVVLSTYGLAIRSIITTGLPATEPSAAHRMKRRKLLIEMWPPLPVATHDALPRSM